MGRHLTEGPRELVTMTFDFGGHCAARDAALHAPTVTKFQVRRPFPSEDITQLSLFIYGSCEAGLKKTNVIKHKA